MKNTTDQKGPNRGHNSGLAPLPCLNSNICTEVIDSATSAEAGGEGLPPLARLSTQHRKTAYLLTESVQKLSDLFGIEYLGFLTLTFSQHITDPKKAQKRLHSLITHIIKPRYREYLGVFERQKSGRIHYHMIIVMHQDIRSGINFEEFRKGTYKSASPDLRKEWSFWRITAKKYGFGRTELLPIRSTAEAIGKYVGKYIAKHCEVRDLQDKGVRLVRYSRGARAGTTRFQFLSEGSAEWRRKVAIFSQIVQTSHPDQKVCELSDLSKVLGKRWAYNHREYILALP